ncbi:MAG: hypothetical protein J5861_02105 [Desulfovibrio sp.]|nr:hypothetical protein [Desulfovibrio sp.]
MWTAIAILAVLTAMIGFTFFVRRALRNTPFEGRTFGCGAGYQPMKGKSREGNEQ